MSKIEHIKPNTELIRLTEKILEQNAAILKMNADLLKALSAPAWVYNIDEASLDASLKRGGSQ